ncbi:MAG TPA: endolytic transglycosylase MltG [Anaerolineaceae bacterium]
MRKSTSLPRALSFVLLGLLCIWGILLTWGLDWVPKEARRLYGPPASSLGFFDRFWYGLKLINQQADLLEPVSKTKMQVDFTVEMNQSATEIAEKLENAGLIRNASSFRLYLVYSGLDTRIKAGNYRLDASQNALEIAHQLLEVNAQLIKIRILAGWRLEEVASAFAGAGLVESQQVFLAQANQPDNLDYSFGKPSWKTMEGLVAADTYTFTRSVATSDLLAAINFEKVITPEMKQGFNRNGISVMEAIILASIIQREAILSDEKPLIASVFMNRLAAKMKLESDPTVQYALGYDAVKKTWWKNPLNLDDLKIDSPYNTYRRAGLPPGPICSPDRASLNAVANPALSKYYYFRAKCDGSGRHAFAETFTEHVKNACP